jgi:hypothetical protein
MNNAAPDGVPPRRIDDFKKTPALHTSERPEAGIFHKNEEFHGSGTNRIDSYLMSTDFFNQD